MSDEDVTLAFVRLTELADARGDVPDDGSGIDGVWTDEIPDVDTDYQWFIAINADGEEREYDVGEDRTTSIAPYHAHAWHNTDLVVPSTILTPYGGEAGVTDEFDRSVEDQLIASIEAVLVNLDALDDPVIYDEEVST